MMNLNGCQNCIYKGISIFFCRQNVCTQQWALQSAHAHIKLVAEGLAALLFIWMEARPQHSGDANTGGSKKNQTKKARLSGKKKVGAD